MQNRFLSYSQTPRRLSATNWSWNPQGFWFTISQAARASGLETIFQIMREMIKKIMQMYQQVWRWEVLRGQAVGWSQLQPCAWGDPLQLCLCLSGRHTVCGRGKDHVLHHDCVENLVFFQLVNNFVYPIGVAVSMACLTLTFLLYLLLPQLRDLTG